MKGVRQQIADNQADRAAESRGAALDRELADNRHLLASVPQALAGHGPGMAIDDAGQEYEVDPAVLEPEAGS
jgi:hypothetical protein